MVGSEVGGGGGDKAGEQREQVRIVIGIDRLREIDQRHGSLPVKDVVCRKVAHLSAYMTEHLQRFGEYTLKLRPVAPLSAQEKTLSDPPLEQSGNSEERSA